MNFPEHIKICNIEKYTLFSFLRRSRFFMKPRPKTEHMSEANASISRKSNIKPFHPFYGDPWTVILALSKCGLTSTLC